MSNAKVSAFAKRRRLNNGSGIDASGSDSSVPGSVKPKSTTTLKKPRKRDVKPAKPLLDEPAENGSELSLEGNSFEPLVEAQVVKFSGIREIEDIGRNCCKVRLSRGQECSFIGVVKLWIRAGSVEVYGATLHESAKMYTIFAPYIDNAVSIIAASKTAEFQLESVEIMDSALSSSRYLPGRLRSISNDLSFQITDFEEQSGNSTRPSTYHQGEFRSLLKNLKPNKDTCVLVSGKRSSSTAEASHRLINMMLSNLPNAYAEKGVAFLDLDPLVPSRTTPGTISLIYQKELLFGPGHAYPLCASVDDSQLISSIFMGYVNDDGGIKVLKIVESLLNSNPEIRKTPLVVRTGRWLATASANTLSNLRKILSPSKVVCVDRTKSSPFYEASTALVEKGSSPEHIPEFAMHTVPSLAEHRHSLLSHFVFHHYVDHVPTWYRSTADLPDRHLLELSIDSNKPELSFLMISGGIVRREDLSEILAASLVTIVANEADRTDQEPLFRIEPFQQNLKLQCIGVAYVEGFDESSGIVKLITRITRTTLEQYYSSGHSTGLVLEKPGPEGQFSRYMLRE